MRICSLRRLPAVRFCFRLIYFCLPCYTQLHWFTSHSVSKQVAYFIQLLFYFWFICFCYNWFICFCYDNGLPDGFARHNCQRVILTGVSPSYSLTDWRGVKCQVTKAPVNGLDTWIYSKRQRNVFSDNRTEQLTWQDCTHCVFLFLFRPPLLVWRQSNRLFLGLLIKLQSFLEAGKLLGTHCVVRQYWTGDPGPCRFFPLCLHTCLFAFVKL